MTALEQIRSLYEYNEWANHHVLEAAEGLSEKEFRQKQGASFDSVQGNLVHIVEVQVEWLSDWTGEKSEALALLTDDPGLDAIGKTFRVSHEELQRFVGSLRESDLSRLVSLDDYETPLWQLMLHLANHGTHHRAETAMALTALRKPPRQLDYLHFELERA